MLHAFKAWLYMGWRFLDNNTACRIMIGTNANFHVLDGKVQIVAQI